MNRVVTIARVRDIAESPLRHFLAYIDVDSRGMFCFESSVIPTFRSGDLVAVVSNVDSPNRWTALNDGVKYQLCTRSEFGLNGVGEQNVFVVEPGIRLRPDPTFATVGPRAMTKTDNPGMLVVPSYSGVIGDEPT